MSEPTLMFIRLSKRDDLSYLAGVERSAAKRFVLYFDNDTSYTDRTLDHKILLKAHRNKSLWIALEQGKPVAFLASTQIDSMLHIQEMSVLFEYQGKGIGTCLINKLIVEAKKRNHLQISLTTDCSIPWNKPFYKRNGFKQTEFNACPPDLRKILLREKGHHHIPDNRVAMIFTIP